MLPQFATHEAHARSQLLNAVDAIFDAHALVSHNEFLSIRCLTIRVHLRFPGGPRWLDDVAPRGGWFSEPERAGKSPGPPLLDAEVGGSSVGIGPHREKFVAREEIVEIQLD
jgi:hypothetical protein